MIEITLSSRHRIRNSSPGGLRPSTLPLGHGGSPQYWLSHVDGEETFLFLLNCRDREPNPEPNAILMLVHRLRRWPSIIPALVQRLVFADSCLPGNVDGYYKPTPTQWFVQFWASAPVLASIYAGSEKEVSAFFTSVLIPSFGRAVTGKRERSDASEKEVITWVTSEYIQPFGNTVARYTWDTQTATDRLKRADRIKATCPHLCGQRRDILIYTKVFLMNI